MKHKRWIALFLTAVLSVTAMSVTAFAETGTENQAEAAPAAENGAENKADARSKASTAPGTENGDKAAKRGKKEEIAEPENAIGKQAAKDAALADAGLTADQTGKVRSRVSQTEDGTVIYKVRFTCDGQRYSYRIDAVTGEILKKSVKEASETDEHGMPREKRNKENLSGNAPAGPSDGNAPADSSGENAPASSSDGNVPADSSLGGERVS